MKKIFSFLFSIYGIIVFLAVMFILFPFVLLASLFGRVAGGNMVYNICRIWADVVLFLWGVRHKNYYDFPRSTDRAVVYVFNHISYIDIPLLMKIFPKEKIRILGKAEMLKVPVFGFFYKMAVIPVDRSSAEARAKSVKDMIAYLRLKTSIVIAPEGTFNMTEKPLKEFYDGAFRIAIETKTDIQPVILLDAYDRMNYKSLFSLNPGKSRAHFLQEVDVKNLTIADVHELKQKVYNIMEEALIKYNASWIKN